MSRLTTLRLGALAAATVLALSAAAPASAGGFRGGGFHGGFKGFHGHGFKRFNSIAFYGGDGFYDDYYGGNCFWKFNGFKKFKVCY